MIAKKLGNTSGAPLQTVDYTYNVRGWTRASVKHADIEMKKLDEKSKENEELIQQSGWLLY